MLDIIPAVFVFSFLAKYSKLPLECVWVFSSCFWLTAILSYLIHLFTYLSSFRFLSRVKFSLLCSQLSVAESQRRSDYQAFHPHFFSRVNTKEIFLTHLFAFIRRKGWFFNTCNIITLCSGSQWRNDFNTFVRVFVFQSPKDGGVSFEDEVVLDYYDEMVKSLVYPKPVLNIPGWWKARLRVSCAACHPSHSGRNRGANTGRKNVNFFKRNQTGMISIIPPELRWISV